MSKLISRARDFVKRDYREIAKLSAILVVIYLALSIEVWREYPKAVVLISVLLPPIVLAVRLVFFLTFYRGNFEDAYQEFIG